MHNTLDKIETVQRFRHFITAVVASAALLTVCASLCSSQQIGQPTFPSPGQASNALFAAVRANDDQATNRILGGNRELTTSGDEQEDKADHDRFVEKYQQMHRVAADPDGTVFLYIGAENWPFPVPLASKNGRWYFDSDAGEEEVFFRQLGENESSAVATCRALAAGRLELGNLSAPFHGYRFRAVTQSGKASGRHTIMFVAYPAEYRSSGVMTFITAPDGNVYEQDLGADTVKLATSINQRSPDADWQLVEADR